MIQQLRQMRRIAPSRARGSILLPAAVAVVVSLVLLASADIGYLFYLKRELQKSADLAAVAGAQRVEIGGLNEDCSPVDPPGGNSTNFVVEAVEDVARRNMEPAGAVMRQVTVRCGSWTAEPVSPPAEFGDPGAPPGWRFQREGPGNTVWVRLDLTAPVLMPLIPLSREIMAHAVAMQDAPVAAFSVGSRLLDLEESALSPLLRTLGVNLPVVGLASYEGLANVSITPSGLLSALGIDVAADLTVGGLNALLAAERVTVGRLLDVVANLAGQEGVLDANVRLLDSLALQIPNIRSLAVTLGSSGDVQGLFAQIVGNAGDPANGVLNVAVGALDVLGAAIGVATSKHAVAIPRLELGLPGLARALVRVTGSVIEPPSIAIGGARRQTAAGVVPGATAYSAQTRLLIEVCLGQGCEDSPGLVNVLLELLQTRIHLPIYIDVAAAKGELIEMACTPEPRAKVDVEASVINMCIGHIPEDDRFSSRFSCGERVTDETLIKVLGVLNVRTHADVQVSPSPGPRIAAETGRWLAGGTPPIDGYLRVGQSWRVPSALNLTGTVESLLTSVFKLAEDALGSPESQVPAAESNEAARKLADRYLSGLSTLPLRLGGAPGAYDVSALVSRVNQDHQVFGKGCLLGLPLLCWQTDRWTDWGNGVGTVSSGLVPGLVCGIFQCEPQRAVTSGSCYVEAKVPVLGSVGSTHVTAFNTCVRRELTDELTRTTPQAGRPLSRLVAGPLLQLLTPITTSLDLLLNPFLTQLLGVSLNATDVHMHSLSCHNARLVY